MDLSLNWLSKFVDIKHLDPEEVGQKITLHTAEIEGLEEKGKDLEHIFTGRVAKLTHIDEKYDLLSVESDKTYQIVCTDKTLVEGKMILIARPGVELNGRTVEARKIAEHTSEGFLMSEKDMGISDFEETVFQVAHPDAQPGKSILEYYPFFRDTIFEIDNKSVTHRPDLWGIFGFARELAAIYKLPLKEMDIISTEEINKSAQAGPSVTINDKEGCYRFGAMTISGISNLVSPLEMKTLLHYTGNKPINLLVDLSNYVMVEVGQPNHTYDLRQVSSGIVVDKTAEEMKFELLDGSEPTLPANSMLIYNGDKTAVGIAGIMGGEKSKVMDDTDSILLEAANFDAARVRILSAAIKTRTDASNRFEKTLVPQQAIRGIERFLYLLKELHPDITYSQLTDVDYSDSTERKISLSEEFVSSFTGANFSRELISDILSRLGFVNVYKDGNFDVSIPWYRSKKDIKNQPDLAEEIARIYGYDNITPVPPLMPLAITKENKLVDIEIRLKQILSYSFGFSEIRTYGWDDNRWLEQLEISPANQVKLQNPRAPYFDSMKVSLVPGIMAHLKSNMNNFSRVQLYEYESVFSEPNGEPTETKSLSGLVYEKDKDEMELFFLARDTFSFAFRSIKNRDLRFSYGCHEEHKPWISDNKTLSLFDGETYLGYITIIPPKYSRSQYNGLPVVVFEFDAETFTWLEKSDIHYSHINPFPMVSLDFNIVADKAITYETIDNAIKGFDNPLLKKHAFKELFQDEKILPGQNSYLFSITIGSKDRTLAAEDINGFQEAFIAHLGTFNLTIR